MKKTVWEVEYELLKDGKPSGKMTVGGFDSPERAAEIVKLKQLKGLKARVIGSKQVEYLPICW